MNRTLLLVTLAGLALAAPLAQAQMSASAVLQILPPDSPIQETGRMTISGTLAYTADQTAMLNFQGVPVHYQITNAPAWAQVVVSPATDAIHFSYMAGPGLSQTVVRPFTLTVDAASGWLDGDVGMIEVTASVVPPSPGKATTAKAMIPVRYEAKEDACHELDSSALHPAPLEAQEAEEDSTLVTQSNAATPLATPLAALAGFGAAGAGVGLLLRKRLR